METYGDETLPEVDESDPVWCEVKRWPALRGEPKLAWKYLWRKLGCRSGDIWVSYCELAHAEGKHERSGLRRIAQLKRHGLIGITDDSVPGRVRVYVWDAREVICRDAAGRSGDAYRPLIEAAEQATTADSSVPPREPTFSTEQAPAHSAAATAAVLAAELAQPASADMAPQPPTSHGEPLARAAPFTLEIQKIYHLQPFVSPSPFEGATPRDRAPAEQNPAADVAPQPPDVGPTPDADGIGTRTNELADLARLQAEARAAAAQYDRQHGPRLLAPDDAVQLMHSERAIAKAAERMVSKLPGDRERALVVQAIIERIRRRVHDPKLADAPMRRVARAVVDGSLPEDELEDLLRWIDETRLRGELQGEAWWTFVGGARRVFARHGLEWAKPSQERTP